MSQDPTASEPPPGRPIVWILIAALAFATMGALTHGMGSRTDWLVIALARSLIMLTSSLIQARAGGVRLIVLAPRTLWIRSLAGSFSMVCNFYALSRLPVADAVLLSNVHPIWIVLISGLALGRRPSVGEILGMTCGIVGIALIEPPKLASDQLAVTAALLASVSTAVAMLGLHRLRYLETTTIVAHFAGVASVTAVTWLLIRAEAIPESTFTPGTLSLLLAIGLSGTLGQFALTRAYASGAPTQVAIAGLTQVVFAMGYDIAFWGRSPTAMTLLGFALVLAPTTWLAMRSARGRS